MTASNVSPNHSQTRNETFIDDYVLARIEFRAKQLAIKLRLTDDQRDDFAQDMVVEVLKAAERFNPEGGASWHTYASRTLDLAEKKLIQAEIRRRHRESGRPASDAEWCVVGEQEQIELEMDLELVLSRMPERLATACRLLRHLSPSATAAELGIHRSSIYRLIKEARPFFEKAGLDLMRISAAD